MTPSIICTMGALLLATAAAVFASRRIGQKLSDLLNSIASLEKTQARIESAVLDSIGKTRDESANDARLLRQEVGNSLKQFGDSTIKSVVEISHILRDYLESFANQLARLTAAGQENSTQLRAEVITSLKGFSDSVFNQMAGIARLQKDQLQTFSDRLQQLANANDQALARMREEHASHSTQTREDVAASLKLFNDSVVRIMSEIAKAQESRLGGLSNRLGELTQTTERTIEALRGAVETKLTLLQEENGKKLDQIRETVDEKLHTTLERRLGESFKLVCERLELVHKGLGEMQSLAAGVGDLKKVLTNVKTRGTLGEVQLAALLEQILSPGQYEHNVSTSTDSNCRVEFAIRLPGRKSEENEPVWLPIDAKFPLENYQRLVEAQEKGDSAAAESAAAQLECRIKSCSKAIRDKYLNPPKTTDFAIMFLPTEGLYAEAIRRPGLVDYLQREHRVVVAGPTTLAAILNSLQMGFRAVAIERRSGEIWKLLGAVKTEFGKFGDILDGVHKRIQQASATIEDAAKKSRTIERKLRTVQELPAPEARDVIAQGDAEP